MTERKEFFYYLTIFDYFVFTFVFIGSVTGLFTKVDGALKIGIFAFFSVWCLVTFIRHFKNRKIDSFISIGILITMYWVAML